MDDRDGLWLAVALAALGVAVVVLSWVVRDMQTDIELLRMTAGVPALNERDGR
jgi:hypothetical protein